MGASDAAGGGVGLGVAVREVTAMAAAAVAKEPIERALGRSRLGVAVREATAIAAAAVAKEPIESALGRSRSTEVCCCSRRVGSAVSPRLSRHTAVSHCSRSTEARCCSRRVGPRLRPWDCADLRTGLRAWAGLRD